MTRWRPLMARLIAGSKKPTPFDKKVAQELDPRVECDCGREIMTSDKHDGSRCSCGLSY